ncbi:MAG: hypothetical protein ABFS02_09085 [Pseudomonadota bacterium]
MSNKSLLAVLHIFTILILLAVSGGHFWATAMVMSFLSVTLTSSLAAALAKRANYTQDELNRFGSWYSNFVFVALLALIGFAHTLQLTEHLPFYENIGLSFIHIGFLLFVRWITKLLFIFMFNKTSERQAHNKVN